MPRNRDDFEAVHGCTYAEACRLNAQARLPGRRLPSAEYAGQRSAAAGRGIPWQITFPQWLDLWLASGKWPLRGSGVGGYCMSRRGDEGPYSPGNVFIQTRDQNTLDARAKARAGAEVLVDWPKVLRELREAGVTQAEIATACRTGQASISDLSTGKQQEPAYSVGHRLLRLHAERVGGAPALPTPEAAQEA